MRDKLIRLSKNKNLTQEHVANELGILRAFMEGLNRENLGNVVDSCGYHIIFNVFVEKGDLSNGFEYSTIGSKGEKIY